MPRDRPFQWRLRLALLALSVALPHAALAQAPAAPAHPADSGVSVDMGALDALPAAPKPKPAPAAKKPAAHAPSGTAAGQKQKAAAPSRPAKKPAHAAAQAAPSAAPAAAPKPVSAATPALPPAATAPPPAPPKPALPASLPAEHPLAEPPIASQHLAYAPGESEVPQAAQATLDALAGQLAAGGQRLQIIAHAGGADADAVTSRRISLARAQAVRSYLIGKGVRSVSMYVLALGNQDDGGDPADRVDLVVVGH